MNEYEQLQRAGDQEAFVFPAEGRRLRGAWPAVVRSRRRIPPHTRTSLLGFFVYRESGRTVMHPVDRVDCSGS